MKAVIWLIVTVLAGISESATQFELIFSQSTNKVVVTDYYYLLEYSVVRGSHPD